MRSILVFIVTLLPTLTGASATASERPVLGDIEVGKAFPTLWLPSADDGRPMSVAQFRGSKLILHVFASW